MRLTIVHVLPLLSLIAAYACDSGSENPIVINSPSTTGGTTNSAAANGGNSEAVGGSSASTSEARGGASVTGAQGGTSAGSLSTNKGGTSSSSGSAKGGAAAGGSSAATTSGPKPCASPAEPTATWKSFASCGATTAVMNTAYATWKTAYYNDCGSEAYIKSTDPSKAVYAVSEGIGYGMLITAQLNKSEEFGKLWAFYKARKNSNGLMRWRYPSACSGGPTNGDNNSASDADVDAALALIVAAKTFSNATYLSDAKTLIAAIKKEVASNCSGSKSLLKPSDGWGGCDDLNPSYFATGYFRVFGKVTSDSSYWDKVATDSLALLATYQTKMNGQVPDWGKSDGTLGGASHGSATTYGFEACRTPWRVAVDYGWYQTADAKAFLTSMYNGILQQDRPFFAIKPDTQNSSMFVGGYATVGTGIDQPTADTYFADWYVQRNLPGDTPVDATTYFSNTLRMLYLITMGGRFDNGQ
jgi:endo-1,4-beta-D-glucanase Y